MKILVFSDTHLTHRFDEKKFRFLKKIISSVDKVIIAGDFWDGYQTSFDKFVTSQWKNLFPLLKKKKTVYCFGNHDKKEFADHRFKSFSTTQTYQYRQKIGKKTYVFEHGNRLFVSVDMIINNKLIISILTFLAHRMLAPLFYKLNSNPLKIIDKNGTIKIQKAIKSEIKKNEYYVCGHMHEKIVNSFYANSGFIDYGIGQYLIIENSIPRLMEERYDKYN